MEKIVMIYQEIDDVKFKMGRQFDFDFLKKYGKNIQGKQIKIFQSFYIYPKLLTPSSTVKGR